MGGKYINNLRTPRATKTILSNENYSLFFLRPCECLLTTIYYFLSRS